MLIIHLCVLWMGAWITYLITIKPVIACSLSWDRSATSMTACLLPTYPRSKWQKLLCLQCWGVSVSPVAMTDSVLLTHSTIKMKTTPFPVPCGHAHRQSFLNELANYPQNTNLPRLQYMNKHTQYFSLLYILLSRESVNKMNPSNLTQNCQTNLRRITALEKKRWSNKEISLLPL